MGEGRVGPDCLVASGGYAPSTTASLCTECVGPPASCYRTGSKQGCCHRSLPTPEFFTRCRGFHGLGPTKQMGGRSRICAMWCAGTVLPALAGAQNQDAFHAAVLSSGEQVGMRFSVVSG
jgi:hypothetical protein